MITSRYTPQTDGSNRSFQSYLLSKRLQMNETLTTRRAKQLLVYNQNTLNNLIGETSVKSKNDAKNDKVNSYHLTPPNENILVKKPFKHYISKSTNNNKKNEFIENQELRIPRPSSSLLLKTAQNVNKFVDLFDKSNQMQASSSFRISNKRPLQYSKYSGLRPLNLVYQEGPTIKNCVGIINEPKNQNSEQIKEMYRFKMKQLEQKRLLDGFNGTISQTDVDFQKDSNLIQNSYQTHRSLF
ncbi:unnamed protein product [Brachionus calyciflorus]|uniref:Uncharacterized protein n=1 Tax=Brachionus calyciflorus TaxID=104777 RepID=A0A813TBH1_9BILA|nr:unnamed protein product [Brachionus calyciflorus]